MKKVLSILLSVVLLCSLCPFGTFELTANAQVTSGTCGDNLTWEYNTATATLTISGTGEMYDYEEYILGFLGYCTPWSSCSILDMETAVIESGVTSIGEYAFDYCLSLTSVTIPATVTRIADGAFYECDNLTDIYYTGTESEWNQIDISDYDNEGLTGATVHYQSVPFIPVHNHAYAAVVTPPTCGTQGYTTYTCSTCGDSYVSDYTEPTGAHNYTSTVTPPHLYRTRLYNLYLLGLRR